MGRETINYEKEALKRHHKVKREHEAALNAREPLSRYGRARAGVEGYKKSVRSKRSPFIQNMELRRETINKIKNYNKLKRNVK